MDAMRSILALDAVGNLGNIVVIHHTDCGMGHTNEDGFRAKTAAKHSDITEFIGGTVEFGAIAELDLA